MTNASDRAAEFESRVGWLRGHLRDHGARGALLALRRNFAWLTVGGLNHVVVGSDEGAVPLLVTLDAVVALAPVNESARIADEELDGLAVEVRELPWERSSDAPAEAARLAGGMVLRDAELEEALVGRRERLSALEHERMRALARDLRQAVDGVVGGAERGVVEDELAGMAAGSLLALGIRAPVLLCAADERIERYRHPLPAGRRAGRRLMLVVVGERHGLHVAITRFAELDAPSEDLVRRRTAADAVLDAMIAATRAGATLGGVLDVARSAYADAGFGDEWRLHHQGGTIGYNSRDRIATPGDATRLEQGMAVAWNPSVAGTKAEATMLIKAAGADLLIR